MKKNYIYILFFILIISSCFFNNEKKIKKAKEFLTEFYKTVKENNYNKALNYYSKEYFKYTSKEDMLKILKYMNTTYGNIKNYKFSLLGEKKTIGTENGIIYYFKCDIEYTNAEITEKVSLFYPYINSKKIGILGHNIPILENKNLLTK